MDKDKDKISMSDAIMMGCPFDVKNLTSTNACLLQTKKKNGLKYHYGIPGIFVSSNLYIKPRFYNLSDAKNLSYMIYV